MKDTPIALDMIFIGRGHDEANFRVVALRRNVPPATTQLISPAATAWAVLEVSAGDATNVQIGDTVSGLSRITHTAVV